MTDSAARLEFGTRMEVPRCNMGILSQKPSPYELAPLQPAIGQSQAYAYRGCANGDRQGLA